MMEDEGFGVRLRVMRVSIAAAIAPLWSEGSHE